ncbi:hypothetical protein ILUMI_03332 [Ignelater luminosus]|uniref:Enoyl reductase (ER) domain-containing protein n=1 Tax=Ignelater luminosus TaxID=2038154 RepID=A0A8K0DGR5_IGNLU|nr:hypothetical protein ILUMI_03332 [Ignelater luminosus]
MLKLRYLSKLLEHSSKRNVRRFSSQPGVKVKLNDHKMRAWQIHSYGDLSELQLTTARIPHISNPDELLIQVDAASLNPIDKAMINGYGRTVLNFFRRYELEFPLTLGRDFAGVVIDKGHGVGNEFKVGDKVYGIVSLHKQGSQAETVIADKSLTLLQPTHLNAIEATSVLYTSMTAWSALYITGELSIRDPRRCKVLILGASGGVGTVATQILKSQHASVIGACSTDAVPLVRSLGADVVFDYTSPEYVQNVASEGMYDIILDCAKFGYQNIPQTWKFKRYVTLNSPLLINTDKYGLVGGLAASMNELVGANLTKCLDGKSMRWGFFVPSSDGLKFIDGLVRNKQIIPTIHKVFKFEELPKAYEALAAGHLRGKIIINMQE